MNIQLYVYDLSNGLARAVSAGLLGTQIDAVYHTSIVFEGVEYVYDGGIIFIAPGRSHLGRPMDVIELGKTKLPIEVIMEYIESLKEIYTADAYDLWTHNCNNFSNDLATFLLGRGIPDHIANLPQTVLDTPFGRLLRPQINEMVSRRQRKGASLLGLSNAKDIPQTHQQHSATARMVTTMYELDKALKEAERSCAIVFFTSATCAPCKKLYPLYQELAAEAAHKAILIIVDVSRSYDIGTRYSIRATPTFMTYLRGKEEDRWSGADPVQLKGNVNMLVQMAWPLHSHQSLSLPALHSADASPVLFSKLPPLGKLKAKMGPSADDASITGVMQFVSARASEGAAEATLPDLESFSRFLQSAPSKLPPEIMFTVVDLMRIALVDPRLSGYFAEEKDHMTVASLFKYVNSLRDCPYALRLVALQMACNLFTTPLYPTHILSCPSLTGPIVELITISLLDDKHHSVRVAAASLSFNIATANSTFRTEECLEKLPDGDQVELAASLLEAISVEEESPEALKGFLLALGYLVYCAPKDGELVDLLRSMDAESSVLGKQKAFPKEPLVNEVGKVLLGK